MHCETQPQIYWFFSLVIMLLTILILFHKDDIVIDFLSFLSCNVVLRIHQDKRAHLHFLYFISFFYAFNLCFTYINIRLHAFFYSNRMLLLCGLCLYQHFYLHAVCQAWFKIIHLYMHESLLSIINASWSLSL